MSESNTEKVSTYGVEPDVLYKIIDNVLFNTYMGTKLDSTQDPMITKLSEFIEDNPQGARLLIGAGVAFAIGNFDRIDKIAMEGDLVDGKITNAQKKEDSTESFIS